MDDLRDALMPTRDCACSQLRRAAREMTRHYEAHFRGSGIRATQFTVLSTIAQAGPIAMTPLAEMLALERTALNRALAPLAKRKLVRIEGGEDARIRLVSITGEGLELLRSLLPRWTAAQAGASELLNTLGLSR